MKRSIWRASWPPDYPLFQFPNPPLLVAASGFVVSAFTDGAVQSRARGTFLAGLSAWAWLELTEGANAVRRVYGVAGLALVVVEVSRRT